MRKEMWMDRFNVLDDYTFKLYPEIKESVILEALVGECIKYNLPDEVLEVLVEAWNSRFWETKGYDGATVIKNKKHPAIANFLHDYHYRCGFASKKTDKIYREILILTGYSKAVAKKRYLMIRVFGSYFRIRHWLRKNVNEPSFATDDLYYKLIK
jgi:hypothetical protein